MRLVQILLGVCAMDGMGSTELANPPALYCNSLRLEIMQSLPLMRPWLEGRLAPQSMLRLCRACERMTALALEGSEEHSWQLREMSRLNAVATAGSCG